MPTPQFHRTPKTRKRPTRRAESAQENFDVQDPEAEIDEGPSSKDEPIDAEDCALLEPEDGDGSPSREEFPALLSSWPPQRPS